MADLLREMRAKWHPEPLDPRDSFEDQIVLVTGGTGGLGLATATHLANLGAAKVIITYRDKSKVDAAIQHIRAAAGNAEGGRLEIEARELDLSRYSSVVSFVENLTRSMENEMDGIDVVILNAGMFNTSFSASPDGWEDTIQANTLSTCLLGILLIQWMKAKQQPRRAPAHLLFVSSGRHVTPDISKWPGWENCDGGILSHFSKPSNWPNGGRPDAMYAISKLLLMYVLPEICKLAIGIDEQPQVIVNSVCPGICNTDLSRSLKKQSRIAQVAIPLIMSAVGKSPELGARYIIVAALTRPEDHGKFLRFYLTDEEYRVQSERVLTSQTGKVVQSMVWREVSRELASRVPGLQITGIL